MKQRAIIIILLFGHMVSFRPGHCGDKADSEKGKNKYPSSYNTGIKVDGDLVE